MTTNDWSELTEVFEELSPLSGEERMARIARIRATRPALADELVKLLRHSDDESGSLTGIVSSAAEGVDEAMYADVVGQRFGAYRVTSHLARGGMGDVYVAERDDGAFEQRVAVKLIGLGNRTNDTDARFAVERQILAKLNHPNIARLLDGGTTPDGIAYFIMEFIDGVPIDDYCRSNRLPMRKRLELFRVVCAAVEYAHQNLIVHRDLKPSNILVTAEGIPKLLDFGIAKLLGDGGRDSQVTQAASRVLTPDFASPEQILGQPVTTSSDVYALGVLLYLLLSGKRPYVTNDLRMSQLEKVVVETLPIRPSQAALRVNADDKQRPTQIDGNWSRRLRGDLDDIVLKALRKEAEQRYGSAQQFSADIRRNLQGRPVAARGHTWPYVLRKFLQRNLLPVTFGTLVVAVGAAAVVYHSQRITEERDLVRAEAEKAAATTQFLVDIFKLSDPDETAGATVTAKEILDIGARRLGELRGQPGTRAMLGTTIGTVYDNLGLFEEARQQLDEAVRLREEIGDEQGLAESLSMLGNVQYELGELDESTATQQRALAINRRKRPSDHVSIAANLNDLGHVIYAAGDYGLAIEYYEQAIAMLERLDATLDPIYINALHDLGQVWQLQGDLKASEMNLGRALDYAIERYGERNSITLTYTHDLAAVLHEMDQYLQAEELYLRVLELERIVLGEDYPNRDATMTNLGRLYSDMNRLDEAEVYLRQAAGFAARVRGARHAFTAYDQINLANFLTQKGEYTEAQSTFEEALAIYSEALDDGHPYIASASVGYAALLNLMNRPNESRAHSMRALEISAAALPAGHWLAASANSVLGESLMLLGELDTAETLLLEGLAGVSDARPRDRITLNALRRLVTYYELRGNTVEAARYRDRLAALLPPGR
ncbi:MAG: serine/threonine protein kinase [Gammaproteobacteria bacterium]|nr:serine/threonine protein kinase [Gammaproteobacteria bacterium]